LHFKGNHEGAPQSDNVLGVLRLGARQGDRPREREGAPVPGLPRQPRDPQGEGPRSKVGAVNVAETCGRCHIGDLRPVQGVDPRGGAREGDRGSAFLHRVPRGAQDLRPRRPQVDRLRHHVSEQCSKCHASVKIMGKFGIETEQVATYKESFHGVRTSSAPARWRTAPPATGCTTSGRRTIRSPW